MSKRPKLDPNFIWISVSQYNVWNECKRKWAAKYIYKLPDPQGAGAKMGQEVHDAIEAYYDRGLGPKKHAKLVASMLKLLPPPGLGISTERQIELPILPPDGDLPPVHLVGYVDMDWVLPDRVRVYDHKTSSNPQYAKSAKQLEVDVQAAVYFEEACRRWPDKYIDAQWTYGFTRGRTAPHPVVFTVAPEVRARVMADITEAAREIRLLRQAKPSLGDVAPNFGDACRAYGGCPFRDACEKAQRQKEDGMDKESILAKLRAKKAAVQAATAASAGVKATEPAPTPGFDGPAPEPDHDPINPPESKLVEERAEPVVAPVEEAQPAAATKQKRSRGRPKKEEKAAEEAPAAEERDEDPRFILTADPTNGTFTVGPALHLYVDCYPLKGAHEPVMLLADIVEGAARAVEAKADVPHWSLAEYGSGPGGLAAEFKSRIPRSGSVVLSSYTAEGKALLTTLEAMASFVVKG